jgi:hypothetical protein
MTSHHGFDDTTPLARKEGIWGKNESSGTVLLDPRERGRNLISILRLEENKRYPEFLGGYLRFVPENFVERVLRVLENCHPGNLWRGVVEQLDPFSAKSLTDIQ